MSLKSASGMSSPEDVAPMLVIRAATETMQERHLGVVVGEADRHYSLPLGRSRLPYEGQELYMAVEDEPPCVKSM